MDWPEIKRRLTKEGTSVQILADLEGVPYKTMYQRIKWHERQDGKKYMPEMKMKKKEKRPEVKPEFLTKELHIPEEKQDIPEDVYTGSANYENLDCKHCAYGYLNKKSGFYHCMGSPRFINGNGKCTDYTKREAEPAQKINHKLMPETIEEILTMYKQCCELADRYTKQAEDWARIMDVMQMEERERIRRT